MNEPMLGGRRRIDRVLSPGYLDGIETLPLDEVRGLRQEAEQEETDLSYVRRLLQGRIDILRAELDRRTAGEWQTRVIDKLRTILAHQPPSRPAPARHLGGEPSRVGEYRRNVERMVADVGLSDVTARSEEEIRTALESLTSHERSISRNRRAVQRVADGCREEIARRYRTREARVSDLLTRRSE
jgi:hypothetical protein